MILHLAIGGASLFGADRVSLLHADYHMLANFSEAAKKLSSLLQSGNEGISLAAARYMLTIGLDFRKAVELEQRIADLEKRFNQGPPT
jgi:hypothetical protein